MAQSRVKFFDGADEEEVRLVKELLCERGYFVRTDGTILELISKPPSNKLEYRQP